MKALILLLGLGFCLGCGDYNDYASKPSTGASSDGSVADLFELNATANEYGMMEIAGRIKNISSVNLRSVVIRFSIYDTQDNKIDEASDYLGELSAGEVWKFSVTGKRGSYRLDGLASTLGRLMVKSTHEERDEKKAADAKEQERKSRDATIAAEAMRQREAYDQKTKQINKDKERQLAFFIEQARKGNGTFQVRLAEKFLTGDGVEKNLDAAEMWARAAQTNNEPRAREIISMVFSNSMVKK